MLNEVLESKIKFVADLSKVVGGKVGSIESLDYVVAKNKVLGWNDEYLVVKYRGGAIQARNCNWNSLAAIVEELGKMVYSSQVYPDDTEAYQQLISEDTQYDYDIYDHESV